jgi:hypothetical protein
MVRGRRARSGLGHGRLVLLAARGDGRCGRRAAGGGGFTDLLVPDAGVLPARALGVVIDEIAVNSCYRVSDLIQRTF